MQHINPDTIRTRVLGTLRIAVFGVSVLVIVLISIDAFKPHFQIFTHGLYLKSQLPVCLVYLADFFTNLFYSADRRRFLSHNWLMLVLSVPYTWLLTQADVQPHGAALTVLHFMPTFRAVFALCVVFGFVSRNRFINVFSTYTIILCLAIYFSSVIFFLHEGSINPGISDYWSALWWCILQATTLGASFYAVTAVGKAIAMIVSMMGMLMFPLFTVFLTQIIRNIVATAQGKVEKNS